MLSSSCTVRNCNWRTVTARMNEVKIPKSPSPSPSQFWKISDRPRNLISASKGREIERGRERGKKERSYVASAGVTGICKLGSAADLATQSEVYKDEGDGGNEGDERQRLRQGQTDRQTTRIFSRGGEGAPRFVREKGRRAVIPAYNRPLC